MPPLTPRGEAGDGWRSGIEGSLEFMGCWIGFRPGDGLEMKTRGPTRGSWVIQRHDHAGLVEEISGRLCSHRDVERLLGQKGGLLLIAVWSKASLGHLANSTGLSVYRS